MESSAGLPTYLIPRRICAFGIDASLSWICIAIVSALTVTTLTPVLNALLVLGVMAVPEIAFQATAGRAICRLNLLTGNSEDHPASLRILIRELPISLVLLGPLVDSLWAVVIVFGVGSWVLLADLTFVMARNDRRSWRDLVSGTRVAVRAAGRR
jgi:hypothetical protein